LHWDTTPDATWSFHIPLLNSVRLVFTSVERCDLVKIKERSRKQSFLLGLLSSEKRVCRNRKQKRDNKPITEPEDEPCDWFILLLLLATPTIWFSLDRKRRSHKRNRKKMKTF